MQHIAVIMASFNRRAKTLAALESLSHSAATTPEVHLSITLVDACSSDGTPDAVRRLHPSVHVVSVSSDVYWASGMARAQQAASAAGNPDFLLWLNDDCVLDQDSVPRLVSAAHRFEGAIVAGAVRDSGIGRISYTGLTLSNKSRATSLRPLDPDDNDCLPIDSFHGNLVLVPRSAYTLLGTIDPAFIHSYGDIDYGLRARKQNILRILAPGSFGECELNEYQGGWQDKTLPRHDRVRKLFDIKGLPVKAHFRFCVRHDGLVRGSVFAVLSYLKALGIIARRAAPG